MSFGLEDEIDDSMTVTSSSVMLRWREGTTVNDSRAAPFIGYNILGSNVTNTTLTSWINTTFQVTPDQWQEATIEGLEPDTQYWFDIAVNRNYSDDTVYQSDVTSGDVFGLISVKTLQSNSCLSYIIHVYINVSVSDMDYLRIIGCYTYLFYSYNNSNNNYYSSYSNNHCNQPHLQ